MNYKILILFFFLLSCKVYDNEQVQESIIFDKTFSNSGFALVYDNKFKKSKIVSKSLDERSLDIFQKNLKKDTLVKITNTSNNKSLIAKVSYNSKYPNFYNSVISQRISKELELNPDEPYIIIKEINQNSTFIANKTKTFDEEKEVANKAPVQGIAIDSIGEDIVENQNKKNKSSKFKYIIRIADFYFLDTAKNLKKRITDELRIKNVKIKEISKTNYRVYLGPFKTINSLKKGFNDISKLDFENLEILKI